MRLSDRRNSRRRHAIELDWLYKGMRVRIDKDRKNRLTSHQSMNLLERWGGSLRWSNGSHGRRRTKVGLEHEKERRGMRADTPRLMVLPATARCPTDGGQSVVDDHHGTPVDPPSDPDGLLSGLADRGAYPVDPLGDRDDPHADPGDRLLNHGDRLADLDGRAQDFADPVAVVQHSPLRVHPVAFVAGHDGGLLRLAAYPDDQLGCRECLAEGRGGLHAGPDDPVAEPADLVACLDDLGLQLPPGSQSGQRSDRYSAPPPPYSSVGISGTT